MEYKGESGAGTKNRTRGLMITNQLLYHLSYTGIFTLSDTIRGQRGSCSRSLFTRPVFFYQNGAFFMV